MAAALMLSACCNTKAPAPYGALPSDAQVEWQKMETNMFVHFGPNTYTGREWGSGREDKNIFNPTELDCRQWVRTARDAGFKGVIITAKHHDGFSLWPNPTSTHTVAQCAWRDGKGDVLRELSDACHEYGLKFGVYLSPWDRNHPAYGSDEYNKVFTDALDSSLGNYGPVFEQWFDGACGEGPNGKRQVYDWEAFHEHVFGLQKDAIVFSNVGPGCRWVGNESGVASETCWSTFSPEVHGADHSSLPGDYEKYLGEGDEDGEYWIPAEVDVSIRPGWFWREEETPMVRSVSNLLQLYYESVGRNALLLLNVPADTRGLLSKTDSLNLAQYRAALDDIFSVNLAEGACASASSSRGRAYSASKTLKGGYDSYWAAPDGVTQASLSYEFCEAKTFNRVVLQEYIPLGQRVKSFTVEVRENCEWREIASATTIGYKRILLVPETTADAVRVNITGALACPLINGFGLYLDNYLGQNDAEALSDDDRICVADGFSVLSPEGSSAIVDGFAESLHGATIDVRADGTFPPIVIDLGSERTFYGIAYTPIEKGEGGCMMEYRLEACGEGNIWTTLVAGDQIDNIVNNPTTRLLRLDSPVTAHMIRVTPLRSNNAESVGIGEISLVIR